ncbi:ATP-binding cassette domain-containing protein [Shinella zoogloeoides]|uniref:ABC transporter ATP-binding protein n=1 Tax=Shinella zoogloeoides TaxID=352475 RepID=UPI0028ABD21E|nr:ATP-binding cassette domain-containing protein [Shinella zoogloeoides]
MSAVNGNTGPQAEADAFRLEGIGLTIDRLPIVRNVSLAFPKGKVTALVGHNGSGKSTLLKIMARQMTADTGAVLYDGRPLAAFGERAFAREIAYLPQDMGAGADMTVRELVACGRYPWHGPLGRFGETDRQKVEAALEATHLVHFGHRLVSTLSGGERQRAWIAMLVAQDSKCLLLDEPTAALDIAHQMEVLSLVRALSHEKGLSVAIVLHDINMAARFCDLIHALKDGTVVASDSPDRLLTPATLRGIYGIDMNVLPHPGLSVPLAYVC